MLIGVLVSLAATFGYVLTYIGRRFFAGYLNALNLGHTPVSLDAQILAETGGQILLVAAGVFAGIAFIELLLFMLTFFVARQQKGWKFLYVILLGLVALIGWLTSYYGVTALAVFMVIFSIVVFIVRTQEVAPSDTEPTLNDDPAPDWLSTLVVASAATFFVIAIIISITVSVEDLARSAGSRAAHDTVQNATPIRFQVSEPLSITLSTPQPVSNTSQLQYTDLFLLLGTDDYMFVTTC